MPGRIIWFLLWISASFPSFSQGVLLSRFAPGNFRVDNRHRLEIYNPSKQPLALGGYVIITRDYACVFPNGTTIPGGSRLVVLRSRSVNDPNALVLSEQKNFLFRVYDKQFDGNYVVLLDGALRIKDAMYYSPDPQVPFLPDTVEFIRDERVNKVFLPGESVQVWKYLSSYDDPVVSFDRIGNAWKLTPRSQNLNPATSFSDLVLRYYDGVVTVKFTTAFEMDCFEHIIERGTDPENFTELVRVEGAGTSGAVHYYSFLDPGVLPDKTYYYRIRNIDKFQHEVVSPIREVKTSLLTDEFVIDAIPVAEPGGSRISIRFLSKFSQHIRIKIVDQAFRETGILFDGFVYHHTQQLVKVNKVLPRGKYRLICDTDAKRFFKDLDI